MTALKIKPLVARNVMLKVLEKCHNCCAKNRGQINQYNECKYGVINLLV